MLTDNGSGTLLALADHFRTAPSKDCHILASYNMNIQHKEDSCFHGLLIVMWVVTPFGMMKGMMIKIMNGLAKHCH